jgi:tRNA(fMet)-specific endonuclease VapC
LLLLDTNHCFSIIAGHPLFLDRLRHVGWEGILTSVVVAGELYYGASISEQADENTFRVSRFLRSIDVVPISSSVAGQYAHLKMALLNCFGPRERARRRDFDLAKLGFRDNDLWIAATAIDRGAMLVSADSDFTRMREAIDLVITDWTRS